MSLFFDLSVNNLFRYVHPCIQYERGVTVWVPIYVWVGDSIVTIL